jgi:hypothetical protein
MPMRSFSRWMPPVPSLSPAWKYSATIVLSVLAIWLLIRYYPFAPAGTLFAMGLLYLFERRRRARYSLLAGVRHGEGLCSFVRAFPRHERDPYVLRAVYEELAPYFAVGKFAVPLRLSDSLTRDLELDDEELEFAACSIARRCGRSLVDAKANPFYGRLKTVEDLVRFFYAQPRGIAA